MRQFLHKAEKLASKYWLLVFAAAVCIVSVHYGTERIQDVNYVCTNGDYQTYNVLRRVLDGQLPYTDFANYLGMGVLLLCSPLLALHNTFAGSLFVSHFVATTGYILFVTLIFYCITGNKLLSAWAGLLSPKLLSSGLVTLIPVYGYYTDLYLSELAAPNNSFRVVRLFWAVLLCLLALGWVAYKKCRVQDVTLRSLLATPKGAAGVGFVVGLGITWSNDFGFSCIGSATLVMLILTLADKVQNAKPIGVENALYFKRFLYYVPALLAGVFLSMLLATRGNISDYLSFTAGVAEWQFWYYGPINTKIHNLAELFADEKMHRTWVHIGIFLAAMSWCLYRLCRKKENDRIVLFVFLFTSILAGQLVYLVGSGEDNFTQGTCSFVILSFWALVCRFGLWAGRKLRCEKTIRIGAVGVATVYLAYLAVSSVDLYRTAISRRQQADYLPQLEGVTGYAFALNEMYDIVGDESLFSTYATALDDMRGGFQPTGSDYIIHALGDERFAAYVTEFEQGDYQWVQTTNFEEWPWEPWAVSANWDFYRQLFSDYVIVSDHNMWTLWQYAGEDANLLQDVQVTVELVRHSDQWVELVVTVDTNQPCYVDLVVSWSNDFTDAPQRYTTWKRSVFVYDASQRMVRMGVGDGFYRPYQAQQHHLPVYVENGTGRIILSGEPGNCTYLTVTEVSAAAVIRFQR